MNGQNILVTGGAGYLGSILVPLLIKKGYQVTVYDRFFFGKETLSSLKGNGLCTLIKGDIRWIPNKVLNGIDIVMDLASISNDSAGELNPQVTFDINFKARVKLAKKAKSLGVKKYILASTCSVYGFQNGLIEENRQTSPITTYAKAAHFAEKEVLKLADRKFCVVVLRQGTLFGLSPRMRFDVVVNTMVLSLFQDKQLTIYDGRQWRPLLHVADSARAFIAVAEAEREKTNGKIFNVGSTKQNFQISELADRLIKSLDITAKINILSVGYDSRSYRVSCDKICKELGFDTKKSIKYGAVEVFNALKTKLVSSEIKTKTFEWYKQLLNDDPSLFTRKISAQLIN